MASVYSSSLYPTDQALKSALDVSYGGGTQDWMKQLANPFFGDLNNLRFARAVMDFFSRTLPAQDSHNHWDDQYRFYISCYYFKQFNFPIDNTDQANCQLFKGLQTAVNTAIEDADKANANGTGSGVIYQYRSEALTAIKEYINTAFATLSCDFYLTQNQQQQQLDILSQATEKAAKTGTTTNYTTYIIYAVIAIIVIMVIVKIFKHKAA
jgi:hypothetical protein